MEFAHLDIWRHREAIKGFEQEKWYGGLDQIRRIADSCRCESQDDDSKN